MRRRAIATVILFVLASTFVVLAHPCHPRRTDPCSAVPRSPIR